MTDYKLLDSQAKALLRDEPDALANAANFVALLYNALGDVNWLGIYVLRGDELVLGPFQGQPACVHIDLGSGVCGTAAATLKTQRVPDVHEFPGHIVCDSASRSGSTVSAQRTKPVSNDCARPTAACSLAERGFSRRGQEFRAQAALLHAADVFLGTRVYLDDLALVHE
jgi:GAF domain-containing protein